MGYPKFGKTLGEITAEVREVNIAHGWRPAEGGPGTNTFGDYIALLHSEASEALEAYRDHRLFDATVDTWSGGVKTMPGKPEGVGSELADVLIRLVDMADVFGIDLEREVVRKIAYNKTRPFRHGGRTLADEVTRSLRPALSVLLDAMPDDPRDWWKSEETGDFIDEWRSLGLPDLTLHDASGDLLTLWTVDLDRAAQMLAVVVDVEQGRRGIDIKQGEYRVCIVQADEK